MDLYKNWDNYARQYNINKFYDVDKKQFLKELTNFIYSFTNKYNLTQMLNKLKTNINNLQSVNLIEDNWKLVKDIKNEFKEKNNKWYFFCIERTDFTLKKYYSTSLWENNGINIEYNNAKNIKIGFETIKIIDIKSIYRWDGNGEPQTPQIDTNTGKITDWSVKNQNKVKDFLNKYLDVIIKENIRVQQGGNPNYESSIVGTQRIIFDFEIINNLDKSSTGTILTKKSIYRMVLTIDKDNNIIAGSLELIHLKQYWNGYDYNSYRYTDDLGFLFSFIKDKENIFNFSAETYNYYQGNSPNTGKEVFEQMKGQIDINKFLKAFFAYALVPVFQNRSNFIESGYIDNLQYDTVLINFFGLKLVNFRDVLIDEKNTNKNQFEKLLNSMFTVSQNFYKDYLRTIFDLENNTYTQGYNKKYGLLSNNGFKIYPRYFYFSDKYKSLDFKMYSAYKNRFYNTNYGDVFNYNFSVANNYNINQNEGYVFEGALKKIWFKI